MELIGLVENHLARLQDMVQNLDFALVHALELPEIMGFSRKLKVFHVFKIVDRINFSDCDLVFQYDAFVFHVFAPAFILSIG